MKKHIFLILLLSLAFNTSFALPKFCNFIYGKGASEASKNPYDYSSLEYLFGLEFTVTNQTIVNEGNRNPKDYGLQNNPIKSEALNKFWNFLKEKCAVTPHCISSQSRDKHGPALRLDFVDGYYFTVGNDSAVIEINAKPMSITNFDKHKHYLDEFIFPLAKRAGLAPHERAGQGHIHISRKAFSEDARLLRNFFVDFQNRPEIIYGALGNHLLNSPPLAAQKQNQREALRDVLEKLDNAKNYSIDEFVRAIHSDVYTGSYGGDWGSYTYYQAFNLTRFLNSPSSATVEIRSFRPQRNTRDFQLQTRLLATWIEKLRGKSPIPYNMGSKHNFTPQEIVNGYYRLISDLGLDWQEFKVLLPENYYNIKPQIGAQP